MAKKIPYEEIREMFKDRGFELLTTKQDYRNLTTKVGIRCNKGHLHSMLPKDFRNGIGCAKCVGLSKSSIEEVNKFAESIGYKVVSTEYINSRAPMDFICSSGHEYTTSYSGLKARGNRCRKCRASNGEVLVDYILSQILHPSMTYHMHYPIEYEGDKYEFDFVIEGEKKTYIEYDGEQHFRPIRFYGGEEGYRKQRYRDEQKEKYVRKRRECLIRIPHGLTNKETLRTIKGHLIRNKVIKHSNKVSFKGLSKHTPNNRNNMEEIADYYLRHTMKETVSKYKVEDSTVYRGFKKVYGKSRKDYLRETYKAEVAMHYLKHDLTQTSEIYNLPKYAVKNYFLTVYGMSKKRYVETKFA